MNDPIILNTILLVLNICTTIISLNIFVYIHGVKGDLDSQSTDRKCGGTCGKGCSNGAKDKGVKGCCK